MKVLVVDDHEVVWNGIRAPLEHAANQVGGEQPLIEPEGFHSYSSFCVLAYPIGRMSGYYTMIRLDTGEAFNVDIPAFNLIMPDILN